MGLHKSFGLVVSGLFIPRLFTRLISKEPPQSSVKVLRILSKISHWGMYGLVGTLCGTGLSMGYFSTFGVSFFGLYQTPALPKELKNEAMAGYAYKVHKYAGVALEYFVALHILGFASHLLVGHNLLTRLSGPVGSLFMAVPWIGVGLAAAYSTKPDKLPEFKNWYSPPPFEVKKAEAKPEEPKPEAK